jgi:hypothetical protein
VVGAPGAAVAALLLAGVAVTPAGCGDAHATFEVQAPALAAVGEPALVSLVNQGPCYGGKVFGGPSDPTGVTLTCPKVPQLTEVLEAGCDDDACVMETASADAAPGYIHLTIVGQRAGDAVLRVRARTDDGGEVQGTSAVTFADATGLVVRCAPTLSAEGIMLPPTGQCGGHYAVFTGSSWAWKVALQTSAGQIGLTELTATVSGGDGVTTTVTSGGGNVTLSAGSASASLEVNLASRTVTTAVPVRVASPDEVVSGELRLVDNTGPGFGVEGDGGIAADIADSGPPPSTLWYLDLSGRLYAGDKQSGFTIRPLLTLAGGGAVFGGGGLFTSSDPTVAELRPLDGGGTPLQQFWLSVNLRAAGAVTFSATLGSTYVEWPVTIVNRDPSGP